MRTAAVWPPTAHDYEGLLHAYEAVLGWALTVGGRTALSTVRAAEELISDVNAVLHTPCSAFDTVSLPRPAGRDVLLRLDRRKLGGVPSLVTAEQVIVLVEAGTSAPLCVLPGVEVASGAGMRLALPPSPGVRWDTPPWSVTDPAPLVLPDGALIREALADGLRLYGHACTPSSDPTISRTFGCTSSATAVTPTPRIRQVRP